MMTFVRWTTAALVMAGCCVFFPGCSCDSAAGTYTDSEEIVKVELRSDGKAYVTLGDVGTSAGEWEQDGEKIILKINGDSTVLTRNDDGSLNGGMMLGTLKKKD